MGANFTDLPILFEEVTATAGAVTMLDRVSLAFEPGPPTVLLGPNGSGKTTLLRIAMGLVRPSHGRITWGSREHAPPVRRAIVFQRPTMLRRSAADNVRYALCAAGIPLSRHKAGIDELLALVGLGHAADRPARRLSAGEQQRLALARALARDPAVLFLDEPTASLDPASTQAVEGVIQTVSRRGIKVVLSTHDLAEARRLAGEVVLLNRGRIVETGMVDDFFNAPRTGEARKFIAGELLV
ncbi:MAG: ATP-binding cassette domain-containing protein [Solimonas sp.]